MAFQCPLCPKVFKHNHVFKRHLECIHAGEGKHVCPTCQRAFSRKDDLLRHQRKHDVEEKIFACEECEKVFTRKDNLMRHTKTHNEPPRKRQRTSPTVDAGDSHGKRSKDNPLQGEPLSKDDQESPGTDKLTYDERPPETTTGAEDAPNLPQDASRSDVSMMDQDSVSYPVSDTKKFRNAMQQDHVCYPDDTQLPDAMKRAQNCDPADLNALYKKHWSDIRTKFQTRGKIKNTFNFRLQSSSIDELSLMARQIFDRQDTAYKINLGFGFFLRNVETCSLQYYYASHNTSLLPEPMIVTDRESFERFLQRITQQDPLEAARRARPNSRWVVDMITNVMFSIYKLTDHPIGSAASLPDYVVNNKALISLQKDRHNDRIYDDNLCFFRCLALHQGESVKALEKKARGLYRQMCSGPPKKYKGVPLSGLHEAEEQFRLNIAVYELTEETVDTSFEDGSMAAPNTDRRVVARLVRRSLERYDETMYLNLHGDHFSYIKDIEGYTHSYQCRKCLKLWQNRWMLNRHEASCEGVGVRHTFPGGVYVHSKTVFELLDEEGIHIPDDLRYHPYRAVFY